MSTRCFQFQHAPPAMFQGLDDMLEHGIFGDAQLAHDLRIGIVFEFVQDEHFPATRWQFRDGLFQMGELLLAVELPFYAGRGVGMVEQLLLIGISFLLAPGFAQMIDRQVAGHLVQKRARVIDAVFRFELREPEKSILQNVGGSLRAIDAMH